jgi:NCAIR mutase (PurE)-related protein
MPHHAATPVTPGPDAPATDLTPDGIRQVLARVARGELGVDQALAALRDLPSQSMGFATLDHHRHLRKGFGEVVYCAGKTEEQVAAIVARLAESSPQVLGTRATAQQFEAARARVPDLQYHELARALWLDRDPQRARLPGAAVVAAGTSDLPVAEEAALTLEIMGHAPQRFFDVGVAGLHRLVELLPALRACHVIVAVAGMEGAMPSVLGGLVPATIIAVPTSVGYGASFHGLAALLGMLNSCAPGVAVVNIDNGFGAGFLAAGINRRVHQGVIQEEPEPVNHGSHGCHG